MARTGTEVRQMPPVPSGPGPSSTPRAEQPPSVLMRRVLRTLWTIPSALWSPTAAGRDLSKSGTPLSLPGGKRPFSATGVNPDSPALPGGGGKGIAASVRLLRIRRHGPEQAYATRKLNLPGKRRGAGGQQLMTVGHCEWHDREVIVKLSLFLEGLDHGQPHLQELRP